MISRMFLLTHIDDVPRGSYAQQFRHQSRVHDVAAAFGDNLPQYRHSQERQIADNVENFVTHEFISETQTCFIQHSIGRQYDRVVE